MRNIFFFFLMVLFVSCGRRDSQNGEKIITVSIAPYKYFIDAIGGKDFTINVMVPAGANPHIYEPFPKQIIMLRKSVAYVSNGYLGFEMTWLDRFYEMNSTMKKLDLSKGIEPLGSHHHHDGDHVEGADPHYWVSPKCAITMAKSVKSFLSELNPGHSAQYEANCMALIEEINVMDEKAAGMFAASKGRSFMIFHPNLGYLARDYGLEEVSVEYEGKEPPPSRLKELIDRAKKDNIKTIFVQKEYDTKNARAIAGEIGARICVIDPLSEDWMKTTNEIIGELKASLAESSE